MFTVFAKPPCTLYTNELCVKCNIRVHSTLKVYIGFQVESYALLHHSFSPLGSPVGFWLARNSRHTSKPSLVPLAWSGLKVGLASILAPKLVPNKILAWLQKLVWPQIWPLKNVWPQISKYVFSSNFRFMSLFIQLLIYLDKYSSKRFLSTHASKYIGAQNTLSWNWSVFIKFFIHSSFVKFSHLH